jgi:hypothetical protein
MSRAGVFAAAAVLLPAAACLSSPKQDIGSLSRRSALSIAPSIGAAVLVGPGATGGQLLRAPSASAAGLSATPPAPYPALAPRPSLIITLTLTPQPRLI